MFIGGGELFVRPGGHTQKREGTKITVFLQWKKLPGRFGVSQLVHRGPRASELGADTLKHNYTIKY